MCWQLPMRQKQAGIYRMYPLTRCTCSPGAVTTGIEEAALSVRVDRVFEPDIQDKPDRICKKPGSTMSMGSADSSRTSLRNNDGYGNSLLRDRGWPISEFSREF